MRPNRVKQIWKNGGAVVNGWLHIPNSWSAEVMAHCGFDTLTIDFQHGFHDISTALPMLQAISTTEVTPFARAPWNEPVGIQRLLDAGAYGIICPMVNSAAECEQFIGACRYFPDGFRSKGPTRASVYGGADYAEKANSEIVTMAMIETATALENIAEICAVKGLDGVYVGPGDLSLTLGGSEGVDFTEPMLVAALDKILAAAQANGIAAGIHCASPHYARMMIEKGWQFVTVSTDTGLLRKVATESVSIVRGYDTESEDSAY